MRIVFFPIDGVVYAGSMNYLSEERPQARFDKLALRLLEELCFEARAQIVLSSFWWEHYAKEALAKILGRVGHFLFDGSDWHLDGSRNTILSVRVRQWLTDRADIESFVILNETTKHFFDYKLEPRLIQIPQGEVFSQAHFDKALRLLTEER